MNDHVEIQLPLKRLDWKQKKQQHNCYNSYWPISATMFDNGPITNGRNGGLRENIEVSITGYMLDADEVCHLLFPIEWPSSTSSRIAPINQFLFLLPFINFHNYYFASVFIAIQSN